MKLIGGLLASLLFLGVCFAGEPEFKIAVASNGQEESGQVSMEAGRALYYLIFDKAGSLLETSANPYVDVAGGAGGSTADFLAEKKVSVVIAGRFGSKMAAALEAANIKYLAKQGIVIDVIKGVEHVK
jgi:predicted Fe-Mo cluster-binding NifX family protein